MSKYPEVRLDMKKGVYINTTTTWVKINAEKISWIETTLFIASCINLVWNLGVVDPGKINSIFPGKFLKNFDFSGNFIKKFHFPGKIGHLQLLLGKLFYFLQKSPLLNVLPVHDKIIFHDPSMTPCPKSGGSRPLNPRGLTPLFIA